MSDDIRDNDIDDDLRDYLIAEDAFYEIVNNGRSPMEAFGIVLGMVANQFKRHGWTRQDFIDFLEVLQETDWPDDKKKPHLTVVK